MKLFFAFIAAFSSFSSFAATPNDFYCSEVPMVPALYSERVIKGCKNGIEELQGVCTVTTLCVYLGDHTKSALRAKFPGRDILKLSPEEKVAFYQENSQNHLFDWFTSTLTCPGVKIPSGQGLCPLPDQCKGDLSFNITQAIVNQDEYNAVVQRSSTGKAVSNPYHYEVGPTQKARE